MEEIDRALEKSPGLYLAGAAYRGVGIPDCIHQGSEAARKALAYLFPDRDAGSKRPL